MKNILLVILSCFLIASCFSPNRTNSTGPVTVGDLVNVGGSTELKCEYTSDTTAVCSCNNEPSDTHTQACLQVLRDNCAPVHNGEAICPVDPS
jgi:hypothetical protein